MKFFRRLTIGLLSFAALFVTQFVLAADDAADHQRVAVSRRGKLRWTRIDRCYRQCDWPQSVRAAAAAVELHGDDSMVVGGGIGPAKLVGQEGKLRAVAIVVQGPPSNTKLAIVACDVLMIERDILDVAARTIEQRTGIPFDHILVNATHTHHAPTTVTIHGYKREESFTRQVQDAIVRAVVEADMRLASAGECTVHFALGKEATVGQNSRQLLADGSIYWIGPRDTFVRPTGAFDPDLPVLAFRRQDGAHEAILFNHSTHTIGTRSGAKRSPSFYGLAAQELEQEVGGTTLFLEGASGSTHNLNLTTPVMIDRIKTAVRSALKNTGPLAVTRLAARRREITVTVRRFDEEKEDAAVRSYCAKYAPQGADYIVKVFREMRRELAGRQGQSRKTWVHAMRIGEVAIVGVPAEFFTVLGIEIKKQSPFPHTIVAELANDYIGYVGNAEAYDLGGYQLWTGLHSFTPKGTGEQIVRAAVSLLQELR